MKNDSDSKMEGLEPAVPPYEPSDEAEQWEDAVAERKRVEESNDGRDLIG